MEHHTDYVLTETGQGQQRKRRIHRATCKRAKNPAALADLATSALAGATPASCCKPHPEKVAGALLALTAERDRDAERAEVVLPYSDTGVAKHFWKVFCRGGAVALADAHGVEVTARATQATLTGPEEDVDRAADALRLLWSVGYEEFKTWRRTDETYLAIRASERGTHWSESARFPAELDWLASEVERTAEGVQA